MTDFFKKNMCKSSVNLFHLDSQVNSVQFLQNRCQILEHILCYSEISPMNIILKDFKSVSDFYLHQLAKEVEIYRLSSDERSQFLDFLDYLHSITRELEDMLLVQN